MRITMATSSRRSTRTWGPGTGAVTWAALLTTLALFSAGCTHDQHAGPDKAKELVWAIGSWGDKADPTKMIVERWNTLHPSGPKVRVVPLGQSADDQRQQMATELTAGLSGFDVVTLDVAWTGEFAVKGWLADLGGNGSRIRQESLDAPLRSATWDGRLWAAPFTTNVGLLYYRTDLVRPDFATNPPKKWAEVTAMGLDAAARHTAIAPFVGQGAEYEGMVVNFAEYLWGAGGDFFDPTGTKVNFAEGPAKEALQFMQHSQHNGFYAPAFDTMTEGEALARFRSGGAVFMRSWTPDYDALSDTADPKNTIGGKFGVVALPSLNGMGTTPAIGGQNLAVSRYSRNARAAREFVTFASTNGDVQKDLAGKAWAPTMKSIYEDPAVTKRPLMRLLADVLPKARARPSTPAWTAISAEIQQNVYPAYTAPTDKPVEPVAAIRKFLERTLSSP